MSVYTVVGGAGFVGSRIVRMLGETGIPCFVPKRDADDVFRRDLGRVFYCAGLTADYATRPFDAVRAHVSLLADILDRGKFERLVYLSSTRLYDSSSNAEGLEDDRLTLEPGNARHLYDLSKALGENLSLTASGGRASVARLSCVYDDAQEAPGFLSQLLRRARIDRIAEFDSSSGFSRDYISVDDVAVTLKLILDSRRSEIFNVASGENVSNAEIADVFNKAGWKITFARDSPKQQSAICSVERIRAIGSRPVAVRDYLKSFVTRLVDHEAS